MPTKTRKGLWKEYQPELEEVAIKIKEEEIRTQESLLVNLESILGSAHRIWGVDYNIIHFMEYCFYKAGHPYSIFFDRYAQIMEKIISLYPGIRRMLNQTGSSAIGNMALGGVGGFKFKIIDQYELIRVLKVWESMGLKKIRSSDVLNAILSKKKTKKGIEAGNVLLLARLSEIFPRDLEKFLPPETDLDTALYEYQRNGFETIISTYTEKGYTIPQMIANENRRPKPVGVKRNNLLAYLLKQKHNFECQLCKALNSRTNNPVEAHHIVPLEQGGIDSSDNMIILCKKHHNEAHEGLIHIRTLERVTIKYKGREFTVLSN